MGKFRVETDNGTFLVETDEPSFESNVEQVMGHPLAAGAPKPPLPAGLQGPGQPNYVQQMKDKLQADRDAQSAVSNQHTALPGGIGGGDFPIPIGLPINAMMTGASKKLDDLVAGAHTYFAHPEQRPQARVAMRAGGTEAAKLAAATAAAYATGGASKLGTAGASLAMGNDSPWATLAGGIAGKLGGLASKLPGLGSLGPTTQLMENGDQIVSPALRPGLAQLIQGVAGQAGANVGASYGDGAHIGLGPNALFAALNLGGAGITGLNGATQQTPAFGTERLLNTLGEKLGLTRGAMAGGKMAPPTPTQFSGLGGETPAIGGIGAGGAATMAPTMPSMPTMQDVMAHMRDIGQTTVKGVKAGARAAAPMANVATKNPSLGAILAEDANKPAAPKAAPQPADAAGATPEPPKKDDKLKPNEQSRPVMAGPGGKPVPAPGSGPVPGDVPPASAVAPRDAKVGGGYGRASSVSVPETDTRYPVRYRLRELDDLNASHNENSFEYNPKYPYENERDYSLDVNQPRVVENSKPGKFEHARIVNDAPEATSGPPITDEHGNVMGGNNRTMMLKRAFADPATVEQHRALLREKAAQFGIDPAELARMRRPVLVREMEPGAVTKDNAQDIIADYNVDPSARKSLEEQAMSDAKRLKPEHWDHLGKIIEEMPEGESMRGILGDARRGPGIIHYLTDTGVFKKNELAKLLTEEGSVTAEAKDRIENMLVGRMFRDARQMVNTPSEVKQKLGGIAGIVTRLRNFPEWDITHQLPEAISALEHGRVNGFANLGDMNKQMDLSGRTANFDDSTLAIADALKKRGPKVFAGKLKTYLEHAEVANGARATNMFEEPKGLEQAFSEAFGSPRGLKPTPRPVRASAEPAAPLAQEAPAAAPPGQQPPDHNRVAGRLHDAIESAVKGRAKVADVLRPGALASESEPIRKMLDAAGEIPEEDFQLLFKKRYARSKSRDVAPANREPVQAALKRLGDRFGYNEADTLTFADDLANLHHKVSGPGGQMADWSESKAHAIPFKETLGKLRAATEAPAAPAPNAEPPKPAAAPPAAPEQPKPAPAAEPKPKDAKPNPNPSRTVAEWEQFLGGTLGGTRGHAPVAGGTTGFTPLPGAASKLGTAGFEPGVQRATAAQAKTAASELANSTQSPAARTAGPAEPPTRELPVAAEKLGTAGFEPQAQMAEDAVFQAEQAKQQAERATLNSGTQGPAARTSGPAEPPTPRSLPVATKKLGTAGYDTQAQIAEGLDFQSEQAKQRAAYRQQDNTTVTASHPSGPEPQGEPPPPAAQRQGTSGYDTRPYEANPGKSQKQLDAEKAAAAKATAKAAKAKPAAENPLASREAAAKHLTEFMGTLYDRTTGSFKPQSSNKLADYLAKNKAVADLATDGSSQGLQTMMDNVDALWKKGAPSRERANEGLLNMRLGLPVGKVLKGTWLEGLRVNMDAVNPMAKRRASAMQPNSGAAETMRYLAQHPNTPSAYVMAALRSVFGGNDSAGTTKALQSALRVKAK